jgi:hypothetical protein
MDENDSRRSDRRQGRGDLRSTLVARFLTPIAAAAASAAAGYAAKKAPDFFERKLLPRLRSAAGDAGGVTRELPARAASVATSAGDMAQELGDKAKSLVTSGTPSASGSNNSKGRSLQEIEKRRDERSRSRNERRSTRAR